MKDAHTWRNVGRAQNERHEALRDMRKGPFVLSRRPPLKDELHHTGALCGRKIA
jgi:hypothetical protein